MMMCGLLMLVAARKSGGAPTNQANAPPQMSASQEANPTASCTAFSATDSQMAPLASVCAFALRFRHNLPDFTCEQTTIINTSQVTQAGCPGSRGFRDPGPASPWEACRLPQLQFWCALFIDAEQSYLLQSIAAETASAPLFRRLNKASPHRIAMQIAQLLHPFLCRSDIKVIVPRLPDASGVNVEQPQLCAAACAVSPTRVVRNLVSGPGWQWRACVVAVH